MANNPQPRQNEPAASGTTDRKTEPRGTDAPQQPADSASTGQDDNLIGAERLPRKGDDDE